MAALLLLLPALLALITRRGGSPARAPSTEGAATTAVEAGAASAEPAAAVAALAASPDAIAAAATADAAAAAATAADEAVGKGGEGRLLALLRIPAVVAGLAVQARLRLTAGRLAPLRRATCKWIKRSGGAVNQRSPPPPRSSPLAPAAAHPVPPCRGPVAARQACTFVSISAFDPVLQPFLAQAGRASPPAAPLSPPRPSIAAPTRGLRLRLRLRLHRRRRRLRRSSSSLRCLRRRVPPISNLPPSALTAPGRLQPHRRLILSRRPYHRRLRLHLHRRRRRLRRLHRAPHRSRGGGGGDGGGGAGWGGAGWGGAGWGGLHCRGRWRGAGQGAQADGRCAGHG